MHKIQNAWKSNFFQVPNAIYDNKELDVYQITILLYLFRLSNDSEAFPSLGNITDFTGVSRPKVIKTINDLIAKGYIQKKTRKNKNGSSTSNLYILLDPSKQDLLPLVNDVNHPSKCGLPGVVNEVNPINTNIINTNLYNTTQTQKYSDAFETFWKIYPRKKDKASAYKTFNKILKEFSLDEIVNGAKRYSDECKAMQTEQKYIKLAQTFLNKKSFLNDREELIKNPNGDITKHSSQHALDKIEKFFSAGDSNA